MAEIQPFSAAHLDEVLALCRDEGWASFADEPDRAWRALTAPGVVALVALDGPTVVGLAQVLTDGAVQASLGLLLVATAARRRGLGRALVAEAIRRAGTGRLDAVSDRAGAFYAALPHRPMEGFRLYALDGSDTPTDPMPGG